jgi:acyl-CoA synthetase (AMP-forming)/AMP-acid ligase II
MTNHHVRGDGRQLQDVRHSTPDGTDAVVTSYGLADALAQHAAATPHRVATVCRDASVSWQRMHLRCQALAQELLHAGVGSGDRVLWLGQNCHRLLETLFAASQIGAVVCPVNWRLSRAELAFVLRDCAPRVILWQESEIGDTVRATRADGCGHEALWIQHDGADASSYEARVSRASPPPERVQPRTDEAPLLMLYTAAFDGRPNGALLSQRALLAQSMSLRLLESLDAAAVYLNSGPMFHIGSLRRTIAVAHAGGRNVMCRRVNALELCRLIDQERCTDAFLQPPTMIQMVEANADRRFDLSSLRSGTGPPGWSDMVTVIDADRKISSGYGQTEVAGVVTYRYPDTPSIGARPGPLARVEVHDPDGSPVVPGDLGEIVVRGPMVMNGYHDRDELNAYRSRGGWHHTNDLGRLEVDGSITFVAPMQRMIKSAAENIYPIEVESVLRGHPAIADAAVIGVPDDVWGQRVKAVIVAAGQIDEEELVAFCRTQLAGYKCPRMFEVVQSLPHTDVGVDRARIDTLYGGGGYPGVPTSAGERFR